MAPHDGEARRRGKSVNCRLGVDGMLRFGLALYEILLAPGDGSRPNLASVLQEGRKNTNIHTSSEVI